MQKISNCKQILSNCNFDTFLRVVVVGVVVVVELLVDVVVLVDAEVLVDVDVLVEVVSIGVVEMTTSACVVSDAPATSMVVSAAAEIGSVEAKTTSSVTSFASSPSLEGGGAVDGVVF